MAATADAPPDHCQPSVSGHRRPRREPTGPLPPHRIAAPRNPWLTALHADYDTPRPPPTFEQEIERGCQITGLTRAEYLADLEATYARLAAVAAEGRIACAEILECWREHERLDAAEAAERHAADAEDEDDPGSPTVDNAAGVVQADFNKASARPCVSIPLQ